jgi:hypothetical protein
MRARPSRRPPPALTVVRPWLPLRLRWEREDRHPTLTLLAAAGLLAAGVLAMVGLPPVDLHGPLHRLGIMDPLCGMTRGTVALLHAQLGQAVAYNPASPLLVAGALLAWVAGWSAG